MGYPWHKLKILPWRWRASGPFSWEVLGRQQTGPWQRQFPALFTLWWGSNSAPSSSAITAFLCCWLLNNEWADHPLGEKCVSVSARSPVNQWCICFCKANVFAKLTLIWWQAAVGINRNITRICLHWWEPDPVGWPRSQGHCIALFSEAKDNVVCRLWEVLTVLGSKALLGSVLGNHPALGQQDLFSKDTYFNHSGWRPGKSWITKAGSVTCSFLCAGRWLWMHGAAAGSRTERRMWNSKGEALPRSWMPFTGLLGVFQLNALSLPLPSSFPP